MGADALVGGVAGVSTVVAGNVMLAGSGPVRKDRFFPMNRTLSAGSMVSQCI